LDNLIRKTNHKEQKRHHNCNALIQNQANWVCSKLRKEQKRDHRQKATCDGDGQQNVRDDADGLISALKG